jgi:serine/threonine protein kinase/WD40 repeat protein/Tfp pilus assembly protein PilF
MSDPDLKRNPVEILAEEFLERYRRGERPAVTDYVVNHPELSAEIREVFPALLAIEAASPHRAALDSPDRSSTRRDDLMPDRLGDFRIVSEIGRGGMGVVYEAVQESLGRQVALKVLPRGALADPAALKRFRREARSVAALHHSNIVPVFGIGEHAGYHYYAMQLIHGQTLEAVLRGVRRLRDVTGPLPALSLSSAERVATEIAGCLVVGRPMNTTVTQADEIEHQHNQSTRRFISNGPIDRPPGVAGDHSDEEITTVTIAERGESQYHRRIARIGLQVAEALAYAHDQGVLHRDIKPSNLLMDNEGTVWVLDFGLAKAETVGGQSASRDIVGTLRYMAPERFDGRSDRRSDVYGLGITLYELLTLRPAFEVAQQAVLIRQILHGAPTSPRHIDRRIPRDLDTIVLKAMSKEPAARYASAHALGEDLRRFLENRTILARRSTSLERTSRWCRRNPIVAALLVSVVALLTFIAGYYSVSATQYRHQFERARAAEIDSREKLFTSYVAQARASRFSRRPGQRFGALRALTEAAKIHRTPELRDEAIAALALPDLDEIHRSSKAFQGVILVYDALLERYARLDWDGVLSVRQVADDRELRRFTSPGPVGENYFLAFSPDGRHLAVIYRLARSHPLKVWRLDCEEPVIALDGPDAVCGARFTPDGLSIAVIRADGSVDFRDLATGQFKANCNFGGFVQEFVFSSDGRKLAATLATDPLKIKICTIPTGEVIREITLSAPGHFTWDPNGSTLAAACNDTRIYLYDTETGRQTGVLADHTSMGIFTAFQSAGSLLASNGWDGKLRIWRPQTGEMLLTLSAGGSMDFRRDGLRFAAQTTDYPVVFQVSDGREYRSLVQSPVRRRDHATCSALHPDGRLLAIGMTNGVALWDIDRDVSIGSLPIGLTVSLRFEHTGALLTMGRTGLARWPVRDSPGDSNSFLVGPPDLLSTVKGERIDESRNGRRLAFCQDYANPLVLDLDHPGSPIRLGPQADVRYIAISPDGSWVATGSHNSRDGVKVWSLPGGRLERHFPNPGVHANALFSPDGRWLATNLGNKLRLWTVGEWRDGPHFEGGALSFSPDGRLLAIADGAGSVRLVEAQTGRLVASLDDPHQSRSNQATFSLDGSRLILTSEDSRATHIWDLRAIRAELVAMGLDWDWAPLPVVDNTKPAPGVLRVATDLGGHDFSGGGPDPMEVDRLNEALEIDPGDLHAMVRRGRVYIRMGHYDQAIADFARALTIRPGDPKILAGRGEAHLWKKQYAPGFADCEASLAALPDQVSIQNALAWAYATAPPPLSNAANALTHARAAVRLAPEIGNYRNTLGVALYRNLQYRESMIELNASLATASRQDAPFDLFFLAMCHFQLGDAGRAKVDFDRACRLQSEAPPAAANADDLQAIRREAEALVTGSTLP